MNNKKPDISKFVEALESTGGNLTKAAKALNVGRRTINRWIAEDNEFREAVEDIRCEMLDKCIDMTQILAFGIPDKDPTGKMIGWITPPNDRLLSNLTNILMNTVGDKGVYRNTPKVEIKAEVDAKYPPPRTLTKEEAAELWKRWEDEY